MSVQDPISDLLTQIRNASFNKKDCIIVFFSNIKLSIVKILKKECFLNDYVILDSYNGKKCIKIYLKYYGNGISVIKKIVRVSKLSSRIYCRKKFLPKVLNGFGIAVISTPVGLLTDSDARKLGHGGEVLFTVE